MKEKEHTPLYNHDVAHCKQDGCPLRELCYRYWLGTQVLKHGWTTAWYVNPPRIGNDCRYFTNKNNY